MKKGLLGVVMVAVLSLVLVGCGGGSGGGSSSSSGSGSGSSAGSVTSVFHVQDQYGTPLVGTIFNYTDPSGSTHATNPSDTNGNFTVVTNQVGLYTVTNGTYQGINHTLSSAIQFQETAEASNGHYAFTMIINTNTGVIDGIQTQ